MILEIDINRKMKRNKNDTLFVERKYKNNLNNFDFVFNFKRKLRRFDKISLKINN